MTPALKRLREVAALLAEVLPLHGHAPPNHAEPDWLCTGSETDPSMSFQVADFGQGHTYEVNATDAADALNALPALLAVVEAAQSFHGEAHPQDEEHSPCDLCAALAALEGK